MKLKHFILLFLALCLFFSCKENKVSQTTIKQDILVDLSKLNNEIEKFINLVDHNKSQKEILEQFKKARLAYKKKEWAIEYFIPETKKAKA